MTARTVVVTGANGNVGAPLVDALTNRNVSIRAAVHGGRRAFDANVEAVPFDYESPRTWKPAFEGARGLFVLRPPHISNVEGSINRAIDAAVDAGVDHVVTLSVMGAGDNPFLPHRRIEKHVQSREVAWTHVRPGFYMQNLRRLYRMGVRHHDELIAPAGDGAANWVDTRDIGALAAVVLSGGDEHHGRIYEPTGSRGLDYHQVAGILSEVLGREISYERAGLLRYIRHMRSDTDFGLRFILFSCIPHLLVRLGRTERVTDDVETVLGRSPRTLREFAEDYAGLWR